MMLTFVKTGYREGYLYQIRIEQKDRARSLVINEIDSNGYKYAPWLVWKIRSVDGYVNVYDDGTNRFTEGYIGDQNAGIYLYQITEFPAWRTNWNATTNPYFYKSAVNPHRISEDNSTYFDGLFAPGQFSFPVGLGEIKLGGSFTKNDDWQQAGSRDGLTVYRYTYDSGDYYDVHVNADSTVVAVEFTLPNIGWDWTKDLRHYLYNNYAEFLTTNAGGQSGGSLVFKAVYHQTSMESILHLTWDDKQTAIKLASTGSL
jgi:hypothetical protein